MHSTAVVPASSVVDAAEEALLFMRKAWEAKSQAEARYWLKEAASFVEGIKNDATFEEEEVLAQDYRDLILSY